MRTRWIGTVLAVAAAVGIAFALNAPRRGDEHAPTPQRPTTSEPHGREQTSTPARPERTQPVSLPAFAQREFNGRDLAVGRVLAQTAAYTQRFITYKSGNLTVSGTMYVPKGAGPFPVLIANHGYIDPDVYTNGRGLRREEAYLASRGYVVIHPDYRNHAQSDKDSNTDLMLRLGYAEDVVNAIRAVRASPLPSLDTERVGLMGHSMGGGIAQTIMVTQPDLVKAVALYAPVSADVRDNFQRWITRRPELAAKIAETYGSPEANPEFWENISPRTFFGTLRIPVIIHHGTADASVPIAWSERTAAALEQMEKSVVFHRYAGESHEFGPQWSLFMERTAAFFDQHLKTGNAAASRRTPQS